MTSTNAQFNDQFNEIRLKIEIEVKMGEKNDSWRRKFVKIAKN